MFSRVRDVPQLREVPEVRGEAGLRLPQAAYQVRPIHKFVCVALD